MRPTFRHAMLAESSYSGEVHHHSTTTTTQQWILQSSKQRKRLKP
jgi:hypothetical protein